MIGLLSLIPGRTLLYAGVAAAALAAGLYVKHTIERAAVAERQVVEQAAELAQVRQDHDRQIAALESTARAAATRAASSATVKGNIYAAPSSTACAGSAPVRAAVDGLRARPAGAGQAVASPGQPVAVPAGTAGARSVGR